MSYVEAIRVYTGALGGVFERWSFRCGHSVVRKVGQLQYPEDQQGENIKWVRHSRRVQRRK